MRASVLRLPLSPIMICFKPNKAKFTGRFSWMIFDCLAALSLAQSRRRFSSSSFPLIRFWWIIARDSFAQERDFCITNLKIFVKGLGVLRLVLSKVNSFGVNWWLRHGSIFRLLKLSIFARLLTFEIFDKTLTFWSLALCKSWKSFFNFLTSFSKSFQLRHFHYDFNHRN